MNFSVYSNKDVCFQIAQQLQVVSYKPKVIRSQETISVHSQDISEQVLYKDQWPGITYKKQKAYRYMYTYNWEFVYVKLVLSYKHSFSVCM